MQFTDRFLICAFSSCFGKAVNLPAESSVAFSCPHLFGCFSFGRLFESHESCAPESVEPIPQSLDSSGVDCVNPSSAYRMNSHQSCCHEDLQVLRDCGATD